MANRFLFRGIVVSFRPMGIPSERQRNSSFWGFFTNQSRKLCLTIYWCMVAHTWEPRRELFLLSNDSGKVHQVPQSRKIYTIFEHKGVESLIQRSNSYYSAVELKVRICRNQTVQTWNLAKIRASIQCITVSKGNESKLFSELVRRKYHRDGVSSPFTKKGLKSSGQDEETVELWLSLQRTWGSKIIHGKVKRIG